MSELEVPVRQLTRKWMDGIRTFHPGCVTVLECRFFDVSDRPPDAARQRA